jgi:hypothetical protein
MGWMVCACLAELDVRRMRGCDCRGREMRIEGVFFVRASGGWGNGNGTVWFLCT